jgi:NADH-quinone oxidoreductase subunit N
MATCLLLLMLSLIGMPPLAGFFGKLYMFMEALDEPRTGRLSLLWLVGLGLLNSVISAFYYVRVLKAVFLRQPARAAIAPAGPSIALPVVLATAVVVGFGLFPAPLIDLMKDAAVPMLSAGSAPSERVETPAGSVTTTAEGAVSAGDVPSPTPAGASSAAATPPETPPAPPPGSR